MASEMIEIVLACQSCLAVCTFKARAHCLMTLQKYRVESVFDFTGRPVFERPSEAEFKEKHGVRDPLPELTITSPYVNSRVELNPMTESTLSPSQGLWI